MNTLHREGFRSIQLNPSQERYLLDWSRRLAFFGGVGNGKTTIGVLKVIQTMLAFPKAEALIGRLEWPTLESTTMAEFYELAPPEDIREARKGPGSPVCIFRNGSKVHFRHLAIKGDRKKAFQRLANLNLNLILIDQAEEIDQEWMQHFRGRLRRKVYNKVGKMCPHQVALIGNMAGRNWIWKEFKEPLESTGKPKPDNSLIEASTYDNREHLPAEFLADLENAPKQWYRRYVLGSWDDYEGLIFGELNRHIHVVQPFEIPPSWERYISLDHGSTNPTAGLWYTIHPEGEDIFFYDTYYQRGLLVREHTRNIMDQCRQDLNSTYIMRHWDPSVFYKTQQSKERGMYSLYDIYIESGIEYANQEPILRELIPYGIGANNDFRAGVERVNNYAKVDPEHKHPLTGEIGAPRLHFFDGKCDMFWAEQGGYTWKPGPGGLDAEMTGPQPEVEDPTKDNHLMDCIRYGILTRPPLSLVRELRKQMPLLDRWKQKEQQKLFGQSWKVA